jgi:hypothetical protein
MQIKKNETFNLNNISLPKLIPALAALAVTTSCSDDLSQYTIPQPSPIPEQTTHINNRYLFKYMPDGSSTFLNQGIELLHSKGNLNASNFLLNIDAHTSEGNCKEVQTQMFRFINALKRINADESLVNKAHEALNYNLTVAAYNGTSTYLVKAEILLAHGDVDKAIVRYTSANNCLSLLNQSEISNLARTAEHNQIPLVVKGGSENPNNILSYDPYQDEGRNISFSEVHNSIIKTIENDGRHSEVESLP